MKLLVLCFSTIFLAGAAVEAAPGRLNHCLTQAARGSDPGSRDQERIRCVKAFTRGLSVPACAKATRVFEYTTNAERMKAYCAFELKTPATATQCLRIARSMDYGASRDELLWGCLRRLNTRLTPKECRALADAMIFPAQKARAKVYCASEIQAVP